MGKKDKGGLKRKREDSDSDNSDNENNDPELLAEMNAVKNIRLEKTLNNSNNNTKLRNVNNKEGLLRALEIVGTSKLDFMESMQICSFDLVIDDENDDLAREVLIYICIY